MCALKGSTISILRFTTGLFDDSSELKLDFVC